MQIREAFEHIVQHHENDGAGSSGRGYTSVKPPSPRGQLKPSNSVSGPVGRRRAGRRPSCRWFRPVDSGPLRVRDVKQIPVEEVFDPTTVVIAQLDVEVQPLVEWSVDPIVHRWVALRVACPEWAARIRALHDCVTEDDHLA